MKKYETLTQEEKALVLDKVYAFVFKTGIGLDPAVWKFLVEDTVEESE